MNINYIFPYSSENEWKVKIIFQIHKTPNFSYSILRYLRTLRLEFFHQNEQEFWKHPMEQPPFGPTYHINKTLPVGRDRAAKRVVSHSDYIDYKPNRKAYRGRLLPHHSLQQHDACISRHSSRLLGTSHTVPITFPI